jgi:hypothetical protein
MRTTTRWMHCCATAALAAAALTALAQAPEAQVVPLAHLKDVRGNVLVSKETGLASGDESAPLAKGARVITTANAEVTVVYDNGCEVKLKPNQRFEVVAPDRPCAELVARAESILAEPAGAVAAAGSVGAVAAGTGLALSSAALPVVVGGGLAGLAALASTRESQAVSPH